MKFFSSHWGYLEFIFIQKCLLSSPLRFVCLLSKLLLFGCRGKTKGKKKKLKYLLLRKHKVDKADTFGVMHVYDIIFYSDCVFVQIM